MQLESIFIGSEDIRAQLPEDSKRFDTIDEDWRTLMADSMGCPNAVEICNREGWHDKLESMEERLDVCQKALDEYLGTKKIAFPRFYFVASADLLDILSKGSNPLDIQHHFSKCFDNIHKLKFDEEKKIYGMYSVEGEFVAYTRIIDTAASKGAVEDWLVQVEEVMLKSVKQVVE